MSRPSEIASMNAAATSSTGGMSAGEEMKAALPQALQTAVLGESEAMPEDSVPVRGYDFNRGPDLDALLASFESCLDETQA